MKKRATRTITGCPRCGGPWTKKSGFFCCSVCSHVHESQTITPASYQGRADYGRVAPLIRDDVPEIHSLPTPRGRRAPLKF